MTHRCEQEAFLTWVFWTVPAPKACNCFSVLGPHCLKGQIGKVLFKHSNWRCFRIAPAGCVKDWGVVDGSHRTLPGPCSLKSPAEESGCNYLGTACLVPLGDRLGRVKKKDEKNQTGL